MKKAILTVAVGLWAVMATAHPIDFEKIRHWTGEGPNRAALVIQFNGDTYGSDAYVWGYRWADGQTPTGEDMFKAICANSSRLSVMAQLTGSMGSTVCGIGYGLNQEALKNVTFDFEKAKTSEFINFDYYNANEFMGQKSAPGDETPTLAKSALDEAFKGNHVVLHPFDYPTYGYPAYDYDCWSLASGAGELAGAGVEDLKWLSAWYEGYWSFWCADRAEDDFMYSGTGLSGRTLSNGSVDAWSFTQFETAQIGGAGEGVEPCVDGAIIYVPERLVEKGVDIDKAARVAGTGSHEIPVVVSWGNPAKIDNAVYRVKFDGTFPSVGKLAAIIAGADPAFKAVINGDAVTSISLDANGDGVEMSGGSDVKAEGNWMVTEYEDALLLSVDPTAKPNYLFYLPAIGQEGVWIPESMTFNLSDVDNYVPVFVQPKAEHDAVNYMWYRRSDNSNTTHSNTSSDIVSSLSTSASTFGKLTYKGNKTGTLYLHVRARIGKGADYAYSNVCEFTLSDPLVPITSLSFEFPEIDAPLNRTLENPVTYLPENATYTKLVYTSSDTKVINTSLATQKVAGSATMTVAYNFNPEVKASFNVTASLKKPVESLSLKGVSGNEIILHPKRMIGILCDVTPADADIPDYDVKLEGTSTDKATMTASMYKVNYWDENNTRIQFFELSGHRAGECKLTITSTDGSDVSCEYTVKVTEPDRTPLENGYTDGTIILNEEWFGHTNGGLNYITPDGEIIYQAYERENPGMSFGATSQFGTIWGGKLLVASKQAVDGGDPLPGGGRVVVADAATLKNMGHIDDLIFGDETKSADARAIAGATPTKVYVGSNQGIYIVDIEKMTILGKIAHDELTSGQIGDMINAAGHVFAIKQNTGVFIIDTATDEVVKTLPITTVQGVTQSADGNVWIASTEDGCSRFTCIDPETLLENESLSVLMPASVGAVACSWGSWRTTPFSGCVSENSLWFVPGASGVAGGSVGKYYRWEIGTDPSDLTPVFDISGLEGSNSRLKQITYGAPRYDDRSGEFIIMTSDGGSSGHYRYNWIHFVDPKTGSLKRTIALEPYYWFQSLVLFPDNHNTEINLEDFEISIYDDPAEFDLGRLATDRDNIDRNIQFSLVDGPATQADETAAAAVSLEGKKLVVTPQAKGQHTFMLAAQSNGRTVNKTIAVNVTDTALGVADPAESTRSITVHGNSIVFKGYNGAKFGVYTTDGRLKTRIAVDSDVYEARFGYAPGIYIVAGEEGETAKLVIK